jgi:CO/xanthine dehydrogenase Mo-binding subunit
MRFTVHDTTQYPHAVRDSLALTFDIDPAGVRVLVPFVGGAFGAGLRVWPHTTLAALAARVTKRPVKLVLTRAQMFTSIGHRPNTIQQLSIGASRDGQFTAIEHVSKSSIGMADELINIITHGTLSAYACPNVSTRATQIRQSIPIPGWMRAPGEAEGSFALESAIDELSYAVGIDPLELRVNNHAHVHPESGLPWSSNALMDCYRQGAERFGWAARNPKPRSMRKGGQLVGYGMARLLARSPVPVASNLKVPRGGIVCSLSFWATEPGAWVCDSCLGALGSPKSLQCVKKIH